MWQCVFKAAYWQAVISLMRKDFFFDQRSQFNPQFDKVCQLCTLMLTPS